jgi:sulfur-carrier protein
MATKLAAHVYVQGEDIRFLEGLDTPVEDGDDVTILPAVAGGSGRGT